jgi:DNA-binding transcriptional MerR regulator
VEAVTGVTIAQLVAAARVEGYQITVRTIRDWSARGLLDRPTRRSLGRGKGSATGLYSHNQQQLLFALLHHRPGNDVSSLARIPVALWLYFGDEYVTLAHARRAFRTWLHDPRSSQKNARFSARRLVEQLDNPAATPAARRHLRDVVEQIAYTGRDNKTQLTDAVRAVFEPNGGRVIRALGHPAAPVTTEAVVELIEARLLAASLVTTNGFTDDDFPRARDDLRISVAEYTAQHSELSRMSSTLYEHPTLERLMNQCCATLLAILGLRRQYPRPAGQPPRHIILSVPLR